MSDLDAPVLASLLRRPDPVDRSQPLHPRQSRLRVELPQRPARARRQRGRAGRAARGRVLRHLSCRRRAGLQRRVVVVSVLRQRIGGRQRHRAGPVRRAAARDTSRPAAGLVGHDRRTRQRRAIDQDWSFVVRVANHGPEPSLGDARDRNAAGERRNCCRRARRRASARSATVVTCELGSLAPGSEAFVIVTIRADRRRRLRQHRDRQRDRRTTARSTESSALTTTRGVRHAPALTLRRPMGDTMFWIGRNNTIQWTLRGVAGGVSVDLSRDDGATWTRLSDEAENVGFYDWTGVGDADASRENPGHQRDQARAHADLTQLFDREPLRSGGSAVIDEQHARDSRRRREPPSATAPARGKTDSERTRTSSCG